MAKNRLAASGNRGSAPSALMQRLVSSAAPDRSEGLPVPLLRIPETDANHQAHFGIELSKAPVPQRRYAAEICTLRFDGLEARFIFGQRCLIGDTLDSALVIRMSPKALKEFADSLDGMSISTIPHELQLASESLTEITSRPQQMANVVANLVSVGVADQETCLDFYHASAFAIGKAHKETKLEVEPVVRVDIRTSLFIALVSKLNEISTEIKHKA